MDPALFLIAILGCGEGDAPCREVRLLDAKYESQAACMAATEAAMAAEIGADYPVVVAQCRPAAEVQAVRGSDVSRPEPGGRQLPRRIAARGRQAGV